MANDVDNLKLLALKFYLYLYSMFGTLSSGQMPFDHHDDVDVGF